MKTIIAFVLFLSTLTSFSQVVYGTPVNDELPKKLKSLRKAIEVSNFPKKIDPIKIGKRYYWKHNTAILCKESEITITEYGAYLFYNNKWNLRQSYSIQELDKNFDTKSGKLEQSEPYTWIKNWRTDNRLYGGWAMWYFIGKTNKGETVCGYDKIETTTNLLN